MDGSRLGALWELSVPVNTLEEGSPPLTPSHSGTEPSGEGSGNFSTAFTRVDTGGRGFRRDGEGVSRGARTKNCGIHSKRINFEVHLLHQVRHEKEGTKENE